MKKRTMVLATGGILSAIAVLIGVALELQWLRLIAKPPIMLALMAWIWPAPGRYARWVLVGLAFSIAGGLLLEIDGLFLAGLIAFLLAHLAYIRAYLAKSRRPALGSTIPFFLYGGAVYFYLWPGLGPMAIPVAIYILAICTMMWRAAACLGADSTSTRLEWAALVGAILFAFSDTLIGAFAFRAPLPALNYPILLLYWIGQLGIVYSARPELARQDRSPG